MIKLVLVGYSILSGHQPPSTLGLCAGHSVLDPHRDRHCKVCSNKSTCCSMTELRQASIQCLQAASLDCTPWTPVYTARQQASSPYMQPQVCVNTTCPCLFSCWTHVCHGHQPQPVTPCPPQGGRLLGLQEKTCHQPRWPAHGWCDARASIKNGEQGGPHTCDTPSHRPAGENQQARQTAQPNSDMQYASTCTQTI